MSLFCRTDGLAKGQIPGTNPRAKNKDSMEGSTACSFEIQNNGLRLGGMKQSREEGRWTDMESDICSRDRDSQRHTGSSTEVGKRTGIKTHKPT